MDNRPKLGDPVAGQTGYAMSMEEMVEFTQALEGYDPRVRPGFSAADYLERKREKKAQRDKQRGRRV